jgi:hypothetical protein
MFFIVVVWGGGVGSVKEESEFLYYKIIKKEINLLENELHFGIIDR